MKIYPFENEAENVLSMLKEVGTTSFGVFFTL